MFEINYKPKPMINLNDFLTLMFSTFCDKCCEMDEEQATAASNRPYIHFHNIEEIEDEGTTLKDIRESYPGSYLVESNDHSKAHRASNYKLENGIHYDLILPEEGKKFIEN